MVSTPAAASLAYSSPDSSGGYGLTAPAPSPGASPSYGMTGTGEPNCHREACSVCIVYSLFESIDMLMQ